MVSKPVVSLLAGLLLSAFGAFARTASVPLMWDGADGESGVPDSIDYGRRFVSCHAPSNEEIDAAETGNPDSLVSRSSRASLASPQRAALSRQSAQSAAPCPASHG